jgi:murein DD-endopeptidase MepM/ murein hydrolase activator NlpD/SH3-like domain-containing protein
MNGLRHFRSIHSRAASVLVAALVVLAGCDDGIPLFEPPPPRSAHERYENGLERAGLDSTALGRDWVAAAAAAISQPLEVALPFREAGYFSASEARAVGYAVRLRAGQELSVIAEPEGAPYAIFLDLFRQTGDTAEPLDLVASIDSVGGPAGSRLTHEARRDGVYVLRLQPELLRSGGFTLTLSTEPTLAFPVAGRDSRAVKSFFGADRDAGARRHHGIDIFAPRGTPVIAATRGTVRSTRPNNLGGNVIWLSDYERGQTLYYAHLDRHIVSPGQQVEIGDTLGFVGNTGNARSTPPHLHFGVYRRGQGPLDPFPFVHRSTATPARITADTSELGSLARSRNATRVVASPESDATVVATIPRATLLRIDAAAGNWFRVRLPDGATGYVAARLVESAERPVRRADVASGTPLRDRPAADAAVITRASGGALPVLAEFREYALVEIPEGPTGWVPSGQLK